MKWNYSVESPQRGRVVYREENREYIFPAYEEEDCLVIVGVPSSQKIYLFFNWYAQQTHFSEADQLRIFSRIEEHFVKRGIPVRFFNQANSENLGSGFYPELFEHRGQAMQLLEDAGISSFQDYGSIDIVHEDYGLEIAGIREERMIGPILDAMRCGFPQWHHYTAYLHDVGGEGGWNLIVSMFPAETCGSGWYDEM